MAKLNLSFRAQSLDNQSPDPVEVNDQCLKEEDIDKRQELAKKISKVSLEGTQVFSEGVHTASLYGDEFLLKTPSDQLDDAGRITPITCYGRVPTLPPASWSGDVVKAVVEFAERIGRTISDKSQAIAGRGVGSILTAEKQNRMRLRLTGKMLWGAGILLISSVCYAIKVTRNITRYRRRRKKVLWGAGGLVIVLAVFGMIYKILLKK